MATAGGSKPISTAIIGYGLSAKIFHIPFIQYLPGLYKLSAIVQRDPTSRSNTMVSNAPAEYPDLLHYTSVEQLLENKDVDLVIISTPPASHCEIASKCLKAGKHVLVEKPFTPSVNEAETLAKLADETGKVLAVYQNRRFDSDFLTLKGLLAGAGDHKSSLGRVVDVETRMDRHRPSPPAASWKTDRGERGKAGGVVYDLGTHLLDQVLDLFGPPASVTGFIYDQRKYPDGKESAGGDSFMAVLQYKDAPGGPTGLTVTAKATVVSAMAPEKQLRYLVKGTDATWEKRGVDIQEDQLKAGKRPSNEGYGVEPSDQAGGVLTEVDGTTGSVTVRQVSQAEEESKGYVEFYKRLAQWIKLEPSRKGGVPSAKDGTELIRLVEAVIESSETGKKIRFGG